MENLVIHFECFGYLLFDDGRIKCVVPNDVITISSNFKFIKSSEEKMKQALSSLEKLFDDDLPF